MYCAVYTTASDEGVLGCVHHTVYLQRGDVALDDTDSLVHDLKCRSRQSRGQLLKHLGCTHLPPSTLDLRESSDGSSLGLSRQKQYGNLQGNLRDAGSGQQ